MEACTIEACVDSATLLTKDPPAPAACRALQSGPEAPPPRPAPQRGRRGGARVAACEALLGIGVKGLVQPLAQHIHLAGLGGDRRLQGGGGQGGGGASRQAWEEGG